jgi:hypothetical protein
MARARHGWFALLAAAGCGGSSAAKLDGAGSAVDAVPYDGLSRCTDTGAARAMLVAKTADDEVDLYALTPGHLSDTGMHLTGISKPAEIIMRDDGLEALVVYGGFGSPFGVGAITIAAGGASAQVEQVLQIGTDSTPISIAYADHDHAVIALEAQKSEVVAIARGGSGWTAGARVLAPAAYPLAIRARRGSGDILYSRSQVGVDQTLDIYRLQAQTDGTWHNSGAHGSVPAQPIAMELHPTGAALYSPTGDPANPVSSSNLDAPGVLHAVKIGADTFTDGGTVALPRVATLLAVDPGGHFVVTDGNIYMLDGSNNPNVSQYVWQTVQTGTDGALGQAYPATTPRTASCSTTSRSRRSATSSPRASSIRRSRHPASSIRSRCGRSRRGARGSYATPCT